MPTFTETQVLDAVTAALGFPSLSEYSLASKEDALRRGLIDYSQYRPLKKVGNFTTVVDQQEYDIGSSYSYLVSITDVFYGIDSEDITETARARELSNINFESLQVIDDKALAVLQGYRRYDHELIDDDIVALMPVPTEASVIYFEYGLVRTLADLRERDYQDIVDFTFLVAAMELAMKRHKILQVNEPGTGFVMFQGGRFLKTQVDDTRKRLIGKFGINTIVAHG